MYVNFENIIDLESSENFPNSGFTSLIYPSNVDKDVYCICTHNVSPCTHTKFRPVFTMYALKIRGMQTVFGFMHTQINTFKIVTNGQVFN